jgi:NTE family protein
MTVSAYGLNLKLKKHSHLNCASDDWQQNERLIMNKKLAFVLGGGGARGAMQVGALRALLEEGYKPDLLVGTSIGAVNAAALALYGVDMTGIAALERAWQKAANSDLLDPRLAHVTLRAMLGVNTEAVRRISALFIEAGVTPDLKFEHLTGVRLGLIGADLTTGQPVIYGQDPGQTILEGLLASIAIFPWFAPIEREGHVIVDGGAFSNLPVEPAMIMGATEIIALNLNDPANAWGAQNGINRQAGQIISALGKRHSHLEIALAEARGVPVHCMTLQSNPPVPLWDFKSYRSLIDTGYETATISLCGERGLC